MLIDEAKEKGVTEISLDATDLGKVLYESLGFCKSEECMVMNSRLRKRKILMNTLKYGDTIGKNTAFRLLIVMISVRAPTMRFSLLEEKRF